MLLFLASKNMDASQSLLISLVYPWLAAIEFYIAAVLIGTAVVIGFRFQRDITAGKVALLSATSLTVGQIHGGLFTAVLLWALEDIVVLLSMLVGILLGVFLASPLVGSIVPLSNHVSFGFLAFESLYLVALGFMCNCAMGIVFCFSGLVRQVMSMLCAALLAGITVILLRVTFSSLELLRNPWLAHAEPGAEGFANFHVLVLLIASVSGLNGLIGAFNPDTRP